MRSTSFDFRGGDGHHLTGHLDQPDGAADACAVFAHCFTCTRQSLAAVRVARALAERGIAVLRFDFTGLGEDQAPAAIDTFSGNVRDIVAASQALSEAGRSPQLLIGHSLGGAAVLAAAAQLPRVKAVVTIGAPFDVEHVKGLLGDQLEGVRRDEQVLVDIGDRSFRLRPDFLTDLASHDQAARIEQLKCALLVLHAPADQVVGIDNAAEIFKSARHPKSFVSLDDADHLLTRPADAAYVAEIIAAWASRYMPGAAASSGA